MRDELKAGAIGGVRYHVSGELESFMPGEDNKFVERYREALDTYGPLAVAFELPAGRDIRLEYRLYLAYMNEFGVGEGDDEFIYEAEYISRAVAANREVQK